MSLVKISVETLDGSEQKLHSIDKSKSLEDNIADIWNFCQAPGTPSTYGLKLMATNDGTKRFTYISVDNLHDIKDGYFIKLVYSLRHYVHRIFDHISDEYKERSFQDLYELSLDPEFIKEIVKSDKHRVVMDVFTNAPKLTEKETCACLIALLHLFKALCIQEIDQAFLEKVITIVKTSSHFESVEYALAILQKILYRRDASFVKWKEEIIRNIRITELMDLITKPKTTYRVQYGALMIVNAIIKSCKGEKRQQLIKEIDRQDSKQIIYEYVIEKGQVSKEMARELYLHQSHILSPLAEPLNSIALNCEELLREFKSSDRETVCTMQEFEEQEIKKEPKTVSSIDNLTQSNNIRISMASMDSLTSEESRISRVQSTITNDSIDNDHLQLCLLTVEALRHYKSQHFKNFKNTELEEGNIQPGILHSSERIVKMLAKILYIGTEPDRNSTCYQPTIFHCSEKSPFFFELFSRTMWLLSKTRREMKVYVLEDFDKVVTILRRQVKYVLDKKPIDLKQLTNEFAKINYETVMKIWEKDKQVEMDTLLRTNPSVQVIKPNFQKQNHEIILEQRMHFIRDGTIFPKFFDKKIQGNFMAQLSPNRKHIHIADYDRVKKTCAKADIYALSDIEHIIEGRACPHVKNNAVKKPQQAFSIVVNNNFYINFQAADDRSAAYWLDVLNCLTGRENRSSYYLSEMEELVKMDLVLHLIELQNVTIPKKAPPVPPHPFQMKPLVPRKPEKNQKK